MVRRHRRRRTYQHSGASAVTNALIDATITLNTLADTLFVRAEGSVSAVVSGTFNSQRRDFGIADGGANFDLSFSTDREYDYVIISRLSAGAQQDIGGSGRARSTISMGGAGWSFDQDRLINCDGCDFDGGSSTGTIQPGNHSIQGTVTADINSLSGTSATANYHFTFSSRPPALAPWIEYGRRVVSGGRKLGRPRPCQAPRTLPSSTCRERTRCDSTRT